MVSGTRSAAPARPRVVRAVTGPRARPPARSRSERLVAYAMMLPALVPYAVFALVPMAWLVRESFFRSNGFAPSSFVGLDNYHRLVGNSVWWGAVWHTLQFGAGRVLVEIPLAMALAWALYRGLRGQVLFRTLYFLPQVLSPAIVGIIFGFFLQQVGGPLNGILERTRLVDDPVDFLGRAPNGLLSLVGTGIWLHFGINTLLFLAGMSTMARSTVESAELDGANQWQVFRHIALPHLTPVTRVVVLIYIVGVLRSFDLVKTLTDGGPAGSTEVMFTYLYRYFFNPDAVPQLGYAAALGVAASLVVAAFSLLYMLFVRRPAQ